MRVNTTNNSPVQKGEVSGSKQSSRSNSAESTKRTDKEPAAASTTTSGAKAEISSKAKEFARAKEVASNAPDVREEKVAELRRKIASGQYKTDAEAIADRMVDQHLEMAELG